MSTEDWFSSMLCMIVHVEGEEHGRRVRSLVLLRASDFDDAWEKALRRGRLMEQSYVGGTGASVTWKLERVETLDQLGPTLTSGREVYSEPSEDVLVSELPERFDPDSSAPGASGV